MKPIILRITGIVLSALIFLSAPAALCYGEDLSLSGEMADISGPDGVMEATDKDQQLFGTKRMIDALNTDPGVSPMQTLRNVRSAVDTFVGDEEQFDDLTMMCIEYRNQHPDL